MKLFRKVAAVVTVFVVMLSLAACGPKPEETVKSFFDAAKKSDIATMATYMKKDGDKGNFKFDNQEQEKIVKAVFAKLSYEKVSSKEDGKNATVKVKVTSLDLPQIYGKVVTNMLPLLISSAMANNSNENDAKNQLMQGFLNAINDPNAPKTTTEVDIKLVKSDKSWLIEPNDDLLNALTGNLSKALSKTGNINNNKN